MVRNRWSSLSLGLLLCFCLLGTGSARAHCDSLDGPVVTAARVALAGGDITPVLKWVKKEYESEIRAAFDRTLAVRTSSPAVQQLADRYFFETVVRLHRAGEGAPYTGLKPAGTEMSPAIAAAEKALGTGRVDPLVALLTDELAAGLRERFTRALNRKKHTEESVEAGREFVEAYVEFMHYAERLHAAAAGAAEAHGSTHE